MPRNRYPTHPIQWKILDLALEKDLADYTLRSLAEAIKEDAYPQSVKHHVGKLIDAGYIRFYIDEKTYRRRCQIDLGKIKEAKAYLKKQVPSRKWVTTSTTSTTP